MKLSLIVLLLISTTLKAFSCSCAGVPSIREAVNQADLVSVVEILDREDITFYETVKDTSHLDSPRFLASRYRARIINTLKGDSAIDTVTIYTPTSERSCGVEFAVGAKYILYGDRQPFNRSSEFDFPSSKEIYWLQSHRDTRQATANDRTQFKLIDSTVSEIRKLVRQKQLTKNELPQKSHIGGYIYQLLNQDKSYGYIYSNFEGEAGSVQLECFFKDGFPVFAIHRNYIFESKGNWEYDYDKPHLVLEQINYIIGNKLAKRAITSFKNNPLWKKSDVLADEQLLEKISVIKAQLK